MDGVFPDYRSASISKKNGGRVGWRKSTAGEAIFPSGKIAVLILCRETNMVLASKRATP
jgi:hypothetical protein